MSGAANRDYSIARSGIVLGPVFSLSIELTRKSRDIGGQRLTSPANAGGEGDRVVLGDPDPGSEVVDVQLSVLDPAEHGAFRNADVVGELAHRDEAREARSRLRHGIAPKVRRAVADPRT